MSANVESAMSGYTIVHVKKQNKNAILLEKENENGYKGAGINEIQ
ncbi:hypothetical protein P4V88_02285 [Bacillus thuringiensis]|nr:hypothetical protein [Bacillus thuringiensis]MED2125971.1 hypothetical protein [Bacillus thuringiensis]MED2148667.1 hypothetical protein [Bacillus thuringiensis]MED2170803.1 hypothetical protein [Bacillus thuringiensis]MED2475909.1 hypothetical protein [Bacillus thuringiensis]MED2578375.1 hypothetical protein [Bacillus thuringiensis]